MTVLLKTKISINDKVLSGVEFTTATEANYIAGTTNLNNVPNKAILLNNSNLTIAGDINVRDVYINSASISGTTTVSNDLSINTVNANNFTATGVNPKTYINNHLYVSQDIINIANIGLNSGGGQVQKYIGDQFNGFTISGGIYFLGIYEVYSAPQEDYNSAAKVLCHSDSVFDGSIKILALGQDDGFNQGKNLNFRTMIELGSQYSLPKIRNGAWQQHSIRNMASKNYVTNETNTGMLGVGQKWYNRTISRTAGTVYGPITQPKMVSITINRTDYNNTIYNSHIHYSIQAKGRYDNTWMNLAAGGMTGNDCNPKGREAVQAIIPSGFEYRFVWTGDSSIPMTNYTIDHWAELE